MVKVEYEQPENKENHNHAKEKGRRNKITANREVFHTTDYDILFLLFHEMGSQMMLYAFAWTPKYELGALQHYILSDAKVY